MYGHIYSHMNDFGIVTGPDEGRDWAEHLSWVFSVVAMVAGERNARDLRWSQ